MIPNLGGLVGFASDPNGNSSYNSDASVQRRLAEFNNAFGNNQSQQPQYVTKADYDHLLGQYNRLRNITEAVRSNVEGAHVLVGELRKELARVDPNNRLLQNSNQRKPDGSIRSNISLIWWNAFCSAIKKRLGPSADPVEYSKVNG